jgi:hypothetical protein
LQTRHVISRRRFVYAAVGALALAAVAVSCAAAELEQATVAAFNHYVEVAEQQMQSSLQADGPFLWIDFRPESSRRRYYRQLRKGEFVIRQLDTYDDGREINIPDGMVHHWIGLAFVPGATLRSAEAVLEDYQDYATIYAPQVRRSRVYADDGDAFRLYLQLYKPSPREVSYNADFKVQRIKLCATRIASSSISTRIAQLQNPSQPDGAEYPVGNDSGYLWRMNNYWRYEQKDGGVYMQVETISLSRDVPPFLGWFVRPIIRRVARQTMADLLEANRRSIQNPGQYAPHADIIAADSARPSAAADSKSPSR